MQMKDAVVVIVFCALAVLTAGALSMGGRLHAKTLMCQKNLKVIAAALVSYADAYDGALPTLEKGNFTYHYYICRRDKGPANNPYPWYGMGCMYSGGFISDGHTFYCPAANGSLDEYLSYCDPAPWGVLPQQTIANVVNQWTRTRRGYVYWPQNQDVYTTASPPTGEATENYKVGFPRSATSLNNLDKSKSVVTDIVFHKEGRLKVNAMFWDGSVIYQDGPSATDGSRLYFNGMQFDSPDDYAAGWGQVMIAEWMWKLHK
jgi:hypothetical protein